MPTGIPDGMAGTGRFSSEPQLIAELFTTSEFIFPASAPILPARQPGSKVDRLAPRLEHKTVKAAPGRIRAWGWGLADNRVKNTTVNDIVPFSTVSDMLVLSVRGALQEEQQPVRLYWDTDVIKSASKVAFWVRSSMPENTELKNMFVKAFDARPFILGTARQRQRIRIKDGQWELLAVDTEKLRDSSGKIPDYLTVWPDASYGGDLALEFNGFLAVGCSGPDSAPLGGAERAEWRRRVDDMSPDRVITCIYTSGTTGPPKGAMRCTFASTKSPLPGSSAAARPSPPSATVPRRTTRCSSPSPASPRAPTCCVG